MRLKQAPYAIRDVVSPIRFAHYTPLYAFRKRDYLTLFILWRHYLDWLHILTQKSRLKLSKKAAYHYAKQPFKFIAAKMLEWVKIPLADSQN